MMFSKDIVLSENGVEQTMEKIYKLRPEFKEDYKFKLEWSKSDIERYIVEFKICQIITVVAHYSFY